MKNIYIILFLATISSVSFAAENIPCKVDPPIDTSEKAWCAIERILLMQSCASVHGFDREEKDLGDRWLLIVKDKNPNAQTSCGKIKLEVCKINGTILHETRNNDCST